MSLVHDSTLQKVVLTDPDNNFNSYGDTNPMPTEITARTSINSAGTQKHLLCDADGHLQVDIISGGGGGGGDATAANQTTMISHLSDIDTAVTGTLNVSDSTAQGSLSSIATSVAGTLDVALPLGAATDTAQASGNASLSSIETAVNGTLVVSDSVAQSSLSNISGAVAVGGSPASNLMQVTDTTAQGSLSSIATSLAGTLVVSDSTAQGSLSSIATSVAGTLVVSNADLTTLAGTVTSNEIAVVSKGGSWSSLVNYASPSLASLGTNTTAAVASKMGQYYAIQFSGSVDGQFSIFVEESIDNSTYVRDLSDINYSNQQNFLYRHNFASPFFRFFVQNNSASTQTITINYVNAL